MNTTLRTSALRLALPKGRMQTGVFALLSEAGVRVTTGARGYRPTLSIPGFEPKLLKSQDVVEMLSAGSRDLGFAGADWVMEKQADLVELIDTGLDPVRIVAAAPLALTADGALSESARGRRLIVASEYARITADWIARRELDACLLRTSGATEVFPPEDADVVVDNAATGQTLEANNLVVIDELLRSSTRLYASPRALEDVGRRAAIEDFALLVRSVVAARARVMIEINVSAREFDAVIEALPCMRQPTVANLSRGGGFAVKSAVERAALPRLVPLLKSLGATDIVVSTPSQIVP